ncbi:unnamed protein product, partial [Ilex paraguariensis]
MWFSATYHKLLALHGEGRVEQNIVEAEEGGGQFRKCSCSSGWIPSEPCEVIYHPGRGRDLRWSSSSSRSRSSLHRRASPRFAIAIGIYRHHRSIGIENKQWRKRRPCL